MPDQHNRHGQRDHSEKARRADNSKENQEPKKIEKKARRKAYITNQAFRWITLTVDVLVFAAVAIYSFFAYQQWQAMNGQLVEMRKTTKAATDGLALTREMNRLDQRAWVGMKAIEGVVNVGQVFHVGVRCKNTGKTFAKNLSVIVAIAKTPKGGEPGVVDFDFTKRTEANQGSVSLLSPNSEYGSETDVDLADITQEAPSPVTQGQIDSLKEGRETVFVFGKVSYTDIFGCNHWTTFCWQLLPDLRWRSYSKFNESDANECLD